MYLVDVPQIITIFTQYYLSNLIKPSGLKPHIARMKQ
jgi:hypothetical protein